MALHEVVPNTPEQASRNNFTVSVYGKSALETNSSAIPSNLERRGGVEMPAKLHTKAPEAGIDKFRKKPYATNAYNDLRWFLIIRRHIHLNSIESEVAAPNNPDSIISHLREYEIQEAFGLFV